MALSPVRRLDRQLPNNYRVVVLPCGELRGGVLGLPSLSFRDRVQQQHRLGWHVGICRSGAFPHVRPVLGTVRGLDTGLLQQLPNERGAFGAVVVEGLV